MKAGVLTAAVVLAAAFAVEAASAPTRPVAIYLLRDGKVAPVRRWVPRPASVRAAIEVLVRGPLANERGYATGIPRGLELTRVSLRGGVASIDFGTPLSEQGEAQVVYTATQFPAVRAVVVRANGTATGPRRGRAAFPAERPAVLVEQPLPGDHVWPTLVVRGRAAHANTYVDVDLERNGRVVEHHVVAAPTGSFTLQLGISRKSGLTVVVYPDGSRTDVVRVPIRK